MNAAASNEKGVTSWNAPLNSLTVTIAAAASLATLARSAARAAAMAGLSAAAARAASSGFVLFLPMLTLLATNGRAWVTWLLN